MVLVSSTMVIDYSYTLFSNTFKRTYLTYRSTLNWLANSARTRPLVSFAHTVQL
jgi:hypothetical protein